MKQIIKILQNNLIYFSLFLAGSLFLTYQLYLPGINGPFQLDDWANIHHLTPETLSFSELKNLLLTNDSGPLLRPVSAVSFGIVNYIYGTDPLVHKHLNIAIHLINFLLLVWFGYLIFKYTRPALSEKSHILFAVIVALWWTLLPIQISTVLYAVQRMTQLAALFSILALISYLKGREGLIAGRKMGWFLSIPITGLFTVLAVFSKENAALLPIFFILIEYLILNKRTDKTSLKQRTPIIIMGWLPIIMGTFYFITHSSELLTGYETRHFNLEERLLTQFRVVVFYIYQILLPRPSSFSLFHDDIPISTSLGIPEVCSFLFIIVTILVAAQSIKRVPLISFGILFYYGSHLLESTILPLEIAFEHRNYLGAYGIGLSIASALGSLNKMHKAVTLVIIILLCTNIWISYLRVDTWSDNKKFVSHTYIYHPESPRALGFIATEYAKMGFIDEAVKLLNSISKLQPWEPGISVDILSYRCSRKLHLDDILKEANERLENEIPSSYMLIALNTLNNMIIDQKCKSISAEHLVTLGEAALKNKKITQQQRFYLLILNAQAHFLNGSYDKGQSLYMKAWSLSEHAPPAFKRYPLIELCHYLIESDNIIEAIKIYNMLKESQSMYTYDISNKLQELEQKILKKANK